MKTSLKESISIDDVAAYLEYWRDSEGFSDINLALDRGFIEYAAYILDSAGAIDSTGCYEDARDTERYIEKMLKRYTNKMRKKDLDLLLRNTEIWVHSETQETYFIPSGDVDYFVSASHLEGCGFVFDHGYGPRGKEFKKTKLGGT